MSAVLDDTRTYRYLLIRSAAHRGGTPTLWVMLNPSTADEETNDPTINKCRGFQEKWAGATRYAGDLVVVNPFALRATDPRALRRHPDPVGPDNDRHIEAAAVEVIQAGGKIVVAWGAHPFARERARYVAALLRVYADDLWCLGVTKDGSPRHPLYVPYSQPLVPWEGYK